MLANRRGQTPKIQNGPHLTRQSTLDHHPPDIQYDKGVDDVDEDKAHLSLEDGPALRQEWVGLWEQHIDQASPDQGSLGNETEMEWIQPTS